MESNLANKTAKFNSTNHSIFVYEAMTDFAASTKQNPPNAEKWQLKCGQIYPLHGMHVTGLTLPV